MTVRWLLRVLYAAAVAASSYHSQTGSYNVFTRQTGFCKMQGFDTVSRATSQAPPVFLDGRVRMGVGLSSTVFDYFQCGRCLVVESAENMPSFSADLNASSPAAPAPFVPFLAMVFDECRDPVCQAEVGYLDFDVYDAGVFSHGNPRNVSWSWAPCPTMPREPLEFLLCSGSACNPGGAPSETGPLFVTVRNSPTPVGTLEVLQEDGEWSTKFLHPAIGFMLEEPPAWPLLVRVTFGDGTFRVSKIEKPERPTPGYEGGYLVRAAPW